MIDRRDRPMRSRKDSTPENHDRWLVSYADFITLLFAFFVVLFASTKSDKAHARAYSQSIEKALRGGGASQNLTALLKGADRHKAVQTAEQYSFNDSKVKREEPQYPGKTEDLASTLDLLKTSLEKEMASGTVRLSLEQRGLIVELDSGAFFALGDDAIHASAYPILERLATVFNTLPNSLRLEGHTDSLPISNSRFHSNWELSAARSIAMLRVLDEKYRVDRKRMAIVGYGDTVQLSPNDTAQGRLRNRRVDIVILNAQGMRAEPDSITKANREVHPSSTDATGPVQTANLLRGKSESPMADSEHRQNKP